MSSFVRSSAVALGLSAVALLATGCAQDEDQAASSDGELVAGPTPFDVVTYAYELVPDASLVKSTDCTVEVSFVTEDGMLVRAGDAHVGGAGEAVKGRVEARRYERFETLWTVVRCKVAGSDPAAYQASVPVESARSSGALQLSIAGSRAASDVGKGNCTGGERERLYVRLRTSLNKKYGGFQGPYGNDYEQTITLDRGAKLAFHPKAADVSDFWFAYCPAAPADAVHVELTLKENDLAFDDAFSSPSADVAVNATKSLVHSASSTAASASFDTWVTVRR